MLLRVLISVDNIDNLGIGVWTKYRIDIIVMTAVVAF